MSPDAIILLGGGLICEEGNWRTTRVEEGDNFGAMGDRLRVEAVAILGKECPQALIIVSGGKGQYKEIPDAPTVASVNQKELHALGIPKDRILCEEDSNNTWQQLNRIVGILEGTPHKRLLVVSNKWHLPRIKVMAGRVEKLKNQELFPSIQFLAAEDILLRNDPSKWTEIIEKAYKSDAIQKRIEMEEKGIEDIKAGRYILT